MLATELYQTQRERWPRAGRHILAHYDEASIIVYQSYRPAIGRFAISHGHLCGPHFNLSRMSWIKPNFLWMMYRSAWGTKEGQEITLGLRIRRDFFDGILEQAVPSSYDPRQFSLPDAWRSAVATSEVRLQWDPDHGPSGTKEDRKAVQLGLRGRILEAFARTEILEVIDLTDFVATQRAHASAGNLGLLSTPVEHVYFPSSMKARERALIEGGEDFQTGLARAHS